ncbi:unnamed protein product [Brachionus calyciflorus]|uniref:PIPK domain-containing protein n=1 Tax=Brachionus calyciflorus TaxID=104777 RepID=A0A814B4K8_9BILA|nr:unnamed protein product [Brachionus calyciflorus]
MNDSKSAAYLNPSTQSPLNSLNKGVSINNNNNLNLNTYSSSISSSSATASLSYGVGTNSLNTMNSHLTAPSAGDGGRLNRSLSTSSSTTGGRHSERQKKKIGHREVKDGVVHYKKISTNELKKSIQFGIVHYLNEQNRNNNDRDLLMQDFQVVDVIQFPRAGSQSTPPHEFSDFKLKVYASYGFRYLRRKFNVNEVDFLHALGETELKEVSNPGASGSVFYKTSNDKYILKTVQYQECEFLKTLLAGYALNLLQNLINQKFTLLPTIYGLYCYQKYELTSMLTDRTNIRIVIMNNILPSDVPIHEKYDLKGSSYKRKASKAERAKSHPTFKDLDFLEEHPSGLIIDEKHYDNIISSLKRDCLILESFGIMDYSLLLGIHNLEKERNNNAIEAYYEAKIGDPNHINPSLASTGSPTASTTYRSSTSTSRNLENQFNISAVPAKNAKGERLLLYFGIIDILQSYRFKKKLEHTLKSMITDGSKISVCRPSFYAQRFINFMTESVFKKATLKGSPSRRKLTFREPKKSVINEESLPPPVPVSIRPDTETGYKNLKDFKPIDSMDSVSGILNPSASLQNQNKFTNISELIEDEQNTHQRIELPKHQQHHLSSNSISIKIEHHSPVKIKTTNDLIDSNSKSPQITRIRSPIESPVNNYKFNGKRNVVPVIKTPNRTPRKKQPEIEIVCSDNTSVYSMTVPKKKNNSKIIINDSQKVDLKDLDKYIEPMSLYSSFNSENNYCSNVPYYEQHDFTSNYSKPFDILHAKNLNSIASFTIDKKQMKQNFSHL